MITKTKKKLLLYEICLLLQPSYSTEELNQEMANLEGLMKDLNAITASEFEC
jgi:ribosomal protein S6